MAACFTLTAGVKFIDTYGATQTVSREIFEGKPTFGMTEMRTDGTLFGVIYRHVEGNTVYFLGMVDYTDRGVYNFKRVNSAEAKLNLDLVPGQTVVNHFTYTETRAPENTTTISSETEQFTFVGFETVTAAGRTFKDACKLTSPTGKNGETDVTWLANGFGNVRSHTLNAQGAIIPGTTYEVVKILSAP